MDGWLLYTYTTDQTERLKEWKKKKKREREERKESSFFLARLNTTYLAQFWAGLSYVVNLHACMHAGAANFFFHLFQKKAETATQKKKMKIEEGAATLYLEEVGMQLGRRKCVCRAGIFNYFALKICDIIYASIFLHAFLPFT